MAEYDYEIVHKRGSQNTNANALSRIGSVGRVKARTDISDENTKKKQILYEFHDSPIGGHRGMNRTYRAIKTQHIWSKMRREAEEYIKQCKSCLVDKILTPKHKAPMEIVTTAKRPFEK